MTLTPMLDTEVDTQTRVRDLPTIKMMAGITPSVAISVVLALVVALWEITTRLGWVDPVIASTPVGVARAIPDILTTSEGLSALKITGEEIFFAFCVGVGSGFAVGILLGVSRVLRQAYLPLIVFLMSTPKVVFLPLFMLSMGITQKSAVAFGAFEAFFYVVVNVVGGVDLVDPRHLEVARAFRASRLKTLVGIILPSALPGVFAALWYGIKHAFLGVLISELWASQGGVGTLIKVYSNRLDTAHVLAIILIISFVAIVAGTLWSRLENRLGRWRTTRFGADAVTVMG
jgi:ABC-type nitrate/sulfonate/bicarbonate transport system permease component